MEEAAKSARFDENSVLLWLGRCKGDDGSPVSVILSLPISTVECMSGRMPRTLERVLLSDPSLSAKKSFKRQVHWMTVNDDVDSIFEWPEQHRGRDSVITNYRHAIFVGDVGYFLIL